MLQGLKIQCCPARHVYAQNAIETVEFSIKRIRVLDLEIFESIIGNLDSITASERAALTHTEKKSKLNHLFHNNAVALIPSSLSFPFIDFAIYCPETFHLYCFQVTRNFYDHPPSDRLWRDPSNSNKVF